MKPIKSILTGFAVMSSLLVALPASAQDTAADAALKALDDALPGDLIHNPLNIEWAKGGNDLRTKVVDTAALPSGQAINAKLKKRQNKPWDSYVSAQITGGVNKGEEIQVYYWARTAKARKGAETADIAIFVGRNEEPYDYIISEDLEPSTEWALKSVKGVASANYPEGTLKVEYQLGRAAQTVELGPVYVSRLEPK